MRTKKQADESGQRALPEAKSFKAYVIKYSFITMMIIVYFSAVLLGLDRSAQAKGAGEVIFSEVSFDWTDLFDQPLSSRADQAKEGARGIEVMGSMAITSTGSTGVLEHANAKIRRF